MKKIIIAILTAATALAAASCEAEIIDNTNPSNGSVRLSVTGLMGEYAEGTDAGTRAGLVSNIRVAWEDGDVVYVYDAVSCLGSLEASVNGDDDRVAVLSGEISAPADGTGVLSLVYGSELDSAPEVSEGKLSFDISSQRGASAPFVVYATIPYDGTSISDVVVPFKFATSVMKVNCTGMVAGNSLEALTISGVNTRCVLALSATAAPTVSGEGNGTISLTEDGLLSISGDGRGAFQIATVASPASSSRRISVLDSSSYIRESAFTSSALAAGQYYNSVFALEELPKLVDLGLPSGTKWASHDLGSPSYALPGALFAWGETSPKTVFEKKDYDSSKYTDEDGLTILERVDDAAAQLWGDGWCIPTMADWEELKENCTWTWDSNSCRYTVTGPSGKSICFTCIKDNEYPGEWYYIYYWTASLTTGAYYKGTAYRFYISADVQEGSYTKDFAVDDRYEGQHIRPVYKTTE